jgi:amidase
MVTRVGGAVSVVRDDALGADDLCGLLARLARRDVSAAELAAAARERAEAANLELNAVVVWTDERTWRTAPAGAFAGVPVLVKDNDEIVGYPTTQGSRAVGPAAARASSPFVEHLLSLGLEPLAKTTMPEFGLTASTESTLLGATANPWDTGRSAGGSSGGSAALVAAGVLPLAHANDGGGSIRIPAACCGLVGLKPTRGRLPDRPELSRLPVPLSAQGVLTRTVRDTARFYAESERVLPATSLPPVGDVRGPSRRRLRIGLHAQTIRGLPVDPETAAVVHEVADVLSDLGHHVEPIGPMVDDHFGPDFLHYWMLLGFALQHGGARVNGPGFDASRTEPFTRGLARMAVGAAPRIPASLRRLRVLVRRHERAFDTLDVVLSPVTGHPPPPLGWLGPDVDPFAHLVRLLRFTSYTPVQNVSGSPAISLPLGRTPAGVPVGVQATGAFGHERLLLELAYELEQAMPWPLTPSDGRRQPSPAPGRRPAAATPAAPSSPAPPRAAPP